MKNVNVTLVMQTIQWNHVYSKTSNVFTATAMVIGAEFAERMLNQIKSVLLDKLREGNSNKSSWRWK